MGLAAARLEPRPGQLKRMDDGPQLITSIDLKSYYLGAFVFLLKKMGGCVPALPLKLRLLARLRADALEEAPRESWHALGQDFSKSVQSGPPVQLGYVPFWLVAAAAPARRAVGCALCAHGNRGGQAAALACAAGTWRNHVRLGLRGRSHATHGGARVWRG